MTEAIVAVFLVVYLGMILGGLPFLQLDRTGIALLGAIALIGMEALTLEEAARSIHLPTLILLFMGAALPVRIARSRRRHRSYSRLKRRSVRPASPSGPPTAVMSGGQKSLSAQILRGASSPGLCEVR